MNPVYALHSAGHLAKLVFVMPEFVGTTPLFIHKVIWCSNLCDLRQPCEPDLGKDIHPILDHHARVHFCWELAHDLELHLGWRDA